MIDIMPIVFTTIYNALPNVNVTNVEQFVEEDFPCVTVQEIANITYAQSQDDSLQEHQARVSYAINVYSTESDTEARTLMKTVDTLMQNMKFTRTQMRPTPNIDHTIHRYTATYEAIVGSDYQMYRR